QSKMTPTDTDPAWLHLEKNRYGKGVEYVYDTSDRVVEMVRLGTTETLITIDRDSNGRIDSITDEVTGRIVEYSYGANLSQVKSCSSCSGGLPVQKYEYDV